MAIRVGKIEGLEQLMSDLRNVSDEAMPILKAASDRAGRLVLARTKQLVPVDTGNLRDELKLKLKAVKKGKPITSCDVTFGKAGAYAVPLELGHDLLAKGGRRGSHGRPFRGRKIGEVKPRPFLRPAADQSRDEVTAIIVDAMNEAMSKLLGDK